MNTYLVMAEECIPWEGTATQGYWVLANNELEAESKVRSLVFYDLSESSSRSITINVLTINDWGNSQFFETLT